MRIFSLLTLVLGAALPTGLAEEAAWRQSYDAGGYATENVTAEYCRT